MVTCAVKNCRNNVRNARGRLRFFRFPSELRRRILWTQFCDRDSLWTPNGNSRICSAHFDEYQYETHRMDGLKKLSPVAIPTICSDKLDGWDDVRDCSKDESNDSDEKLKCVGYEEFMYHQCLVWLDHDYCKVWSENMQTPIKTEAIFVKSEPEWWKEDSDIVNSDHSSDLQLIEADVKED